jgi:O-methyltransferase
MKRAIRRVLRLAGYKLVPFEQPTTARELNPDITDSEWQTFCCVQPYTMTSLERVLAAIRATGYVVANGIPGAIVECGVWRGGSTMAIARTLLEHGDASRHLYLYDTFEGMTDPTTCDIDFRGAHAATLLKQQSDRKLESTLWAYASLENVRANLSQTNYPPSKVAYVKGPVESTIPGVAPDRIALLRLDTDWYESTRHELTHLYPRLSPGGILIIDDYGHWGGAKKAVDEFFGGRVFLSRIDYTGRLVTKAQ